MEENLIEVKTKKQNNMANVKADLRIQFDNKETELIKELVVRTATIETIMAHDSEHFPLDVLLDWSSLVSELFSVYGSDISQRKSASWNKLNHIFSRLNAYHVNVFSNMEDQEHIIKNQMNCMYSEIQSIRRYFTVAHAELF